MSNLKFLLQENLKQFNLEKSPKIDEIIFMLEDIFENNKDYSDYELYFDEKCLKDYKINVQKVITAELEKTLKKNKQNVYKIYLLLQKNASNIGPILEKFIDFDIFTSSYEPYKKLSQQIDVLREVGKVEEADTLTLKMENMKSEIKITLPKIIKEYYEDGNLTINHIQNDNSIFANLIKHLVKQMISIKDIKNKRIIDGEYTDTLIALLTNEKYADFTTFINDYELLEKNDYSDDLNFLLSQYKIVKDMTFEEFISNLRELYDNDLLKSQILYDIFAGDYSKVLSISSSRVKFIINIFIDVLMKCEIPYNVRYMNHLEKIYTRLDQTSLYNKLVDKSKLQMDILNLYELLVTKIISMHKAKEQEEDVLYYLLQFYINNDISSSAYEELSSITRVVYNLSDDITKNHELLSNHMQKLLSQNIKDLTFLQEYDTKNLNMRLKLDNFNDEFISQQQELYLTEKISKKDYIHLVVPKLDNINLLELFKTYNLWQKILAKTNVSAQNSLKTIFFDILSKLFIHFIKAFLHQEKLLENGDITIIRDLFYLQNDDPRLRVYVPNQIEAVLLYLKNLHKQDKTSNDLYEFSIQTFLDLIFDFTFQSEEYQTDISLFDIFKYYPSQTGSMRNIISDIKIKGLKFDKFKSSFNKMAKENYNEYTEKLLDSAANKKMKVIFEKYFTEEEVAWLLLNNARYSKAFFVLTPNKHDWEKNGVPKLYKNFVAFHMNLLKSNKMPKNNKPSISNIRKIDQSTTTPAQLMKMFNKANKTTFNMTSKTSKKMKVPTTIQIGSIGTTISDTIEYQVNDLSFIEIKNMKKLLKNKEDVDIDYTEMVRVLTKNNISYLNTLFNKSVDNSELIKIVIQNKKRILGIKNKFLSYLSIAKYDYGKKSLELTNNIIKFLSILYFINENRDSLQSMMEPKNKTIRTFKEKVFIDKTVYSIKDKKIGKVLSKKTRKVKNKVVDETNIYRVQIGKKIKNIEDLDFIVLDNMKNKVVKVTRGVYKGQLGMIQEGTKYINDKEQQQITKQIKQQEKLLMEKQSFIHKMSKKDNADKQSIVLANRNINNINNELRLLKFKLSKKTFVIKLYFGSIKEINIRLNEEEFVLQLKSLQDEKIKEILDSAFKHYKSFTFNNIYDFSKFLFSTMQDGSSNITFKHFEFLYKNTLKIINDENTSKLNKIHSNDFIAEKIQKVERNLVILKKKLSKEKTVDIVKNITKFQKILAGLKNKLSDSVVDVYKQKVMSKTDTQYQDDLSYEKYNDEYFTTFKVNKDKLALDHAKFLAKIKKQENEIKEQQEYNFRKYADLAKTRYADLLEGLEEYTSSECNFVNTLLESSLKEEELSLEDIENLIDEELDIPEIKPKSWVDLDEESSDEFSDTSVSPVKALNVVDQW